MGTDTRNVSGMFRVAVRGKLHKLIEDASRYIQVRAVVDVIQEELNTLSKKLLLPSHLLPETKTEDPGEWGIAEWKQWSNELAQAIPPDIDGDASQESLILDWVKWAGLIHTRRRDLTPDQQAEQTLARGRPPHQGWKNEASSNDH